MLPYGNIIGLNLANQAKDSRSGTIMVWVNESVAIIPDRE
jgi:hypothetical protein